MVDPVKRAVERSPRWLQLVLRNAATRAIYRRVDGLFVAAHNRQKGRTHVRSVDGMESVVRDRRSQLYVEPHRNASEIRSILRDWDYDLDGVAPERDDGEHPTIVACP